MGQNVRAQKGKPKKNIERQMGRVGVSKVEQPDKEQPGTKASGEENVTNNIGNMNEKERAAELFDEVRTKKK